MKWVKKNDSTLAEFWTSQGDTILHVLTELSGFEWIESEFEIYLLRYFPTIGSDNPLILPIGGINNGSFTEAAPDFNKLRLLLIYQLAKRMLLQAENQDNPLVVPISNHPLMKKSAYRFDNLAMLLAVTTSYTIMGVDTTFDVTQSTFWKNKFPGRKIFEEYFEKSWIITPDKPLIDWIADEPVRSQLVRVTRTPQKKVSETTKEKKKFIEDLPLKGQFGFTVKLNASNQLAISKIDTYRLGYACGLRLDDVIRRIDGRIVRNHKQIVQRLLEKLEDGGSVMEIIRAKQAMEIIIQPLEIDYYSDEYYFDDYNQDDTLYFDTLSPEADN